MSTDEINFRISDRIQREIELYDGGPLDDAEAQSVIDEKVEEWNEAGDTAYFVRSPLHKEKAS